jgi:uncharacterized protein YprB with RNaseH-like and TPR domain
MASDELRKRLERLNRGPLGGVVKRASAMPGAALREEPSSTIEAPPVDSGSVDCGAVGQSDKRRWGLDRLVPGRAVESEFGSYWSVVRRVEEEWDEARRIATRLLKCHADFETSGSNAAAHPSLAEALKGSPGDFLFMDLETCGFAGTPVFLIGAMYVDDGALVCEQLLARSYAEEAVILRRLAELVQVRGHLVTYNGKSFDWPFVTGRAAVSLAPMPAPRLHCDLLHAARRRYRGVLPDCKLQTLERYVCGRRRTGDIPGAEIPGAYHAFVRDGDARLMRDVVHHNLLDLVTMADILAALAV